MERTELFEQAEQIAIDITEKSQKSVEAHQKFVEDVNAIVLHLKDKGIEKSVIQQTIQKMYKNEIDRFSTIRGDATYIYRVFIEPNFRD